MLKLFKIQQLVIVLFSLWVLFVDYNDQRGVILFGVRNHYELNWPAIFFLILSIFTLKIYSKSPKLSALISILLPIYGMGFVKLALLPWIGPDPRFGIGYKGTEEGILAIFLLACSIISLVQFVLSFKSIWTRRNA